MPVGTLLASSAEGLVKGVGGVLDELFTSDEEKIKAKAALLQIQQLPAIKNMELNIQEAKHASVFVAGWRPFIGWVCGAGLAYAVIFQPLIAWGFVAAGVEVQAPPKIDLQTLGALVLSMLGYGTVRTIEKIKGVSNPGKQK